MMSSEATNEFFWQDIPATGNADIDASDLQRISLGGFVQPESQSQQPMQIQHQSSPSIVTTSDENANNNNRISTSSSPANTTQQPLLPPGVVNPDAIIPQSRSYTCRICQVTFPNKSAVTVHSRIHTNHEGKPYRCGFCQKGFSTNFYLKQHERIHNGQKPYKCPMCEHSFKQLSHVQQHVRTHTGVRPYKCHWPGCGKAFLQQSHLKSHVARHTPKPSNGIRPYKCQWPDCGKSFAQVSNLKSHVARHAPKNQKGRKEQTTEQKIIETVDLKQEVEELDSSSFSLVQVPPDVIGQAAAAANIVPVSLEYESICPFLCPGCSKLYVREATFKKHLEECKTKLQMSISATAAALGIEPPPLPPPNTQVPNFNSGAVTLPMDVSLQNDTGQNIAVRKSSKKGQKGAERVDIQQFNQQQIIVEMPLDVSLGNCSPQLSDGSLNDMGVKQEVLSIPLDVDNSSENVMFKLPHILNAVGVNANNASSSLAVTANSINSFYSSVSYNQLQSSTSLAAENALFNNQQLVTSSPIALPLVVSQPLTSSQSVMLGSTSIQNTEAVKSDNSGKGEPTTGHSTINQAALRWQWDQPVPKMNFP